jgi:hypothetical protein
MSKVIGVPTHDPTEGVTVIVPVIGVVPGLVAVNVPISPLPEVPKPMDALELVQLYVTPDDELVNAGTVILPVLHWEISATGFIVGVVPTVIVYVCAGPVQPEIVGVKVTVPVIDPEPVLFAAVNALTFPFPLPPKPTLVLEFVQLTVAVAGTTVTVVAGAGSPAQYVWFAKAVIVGDGLTVILNVDTGPVHDPMVGVTEMVLVIDAPVVFVAVKAGMLVVPEAPHPVAVLLFVQLKLAPAGLLVNVFKGTVAPAQTVMFGSATTVGDDPTVTVTVPLLEQLPVVPVTV